MKCDHCCYSCTEKGEDMTLEVFERCLELEEESCSIGGGEPTLHPDFLTFLITAIAKCEYVWLATNGKIKERAMLLAKLARRGIIDCELSQDEFHDDIDPEVIDSFWEGHNKSKNYSPYGNEVRDGRGIRDVSSKLINSGRCDIGEEGCPCEDLLIKPNGDIYACGCEDSPKLGNIMQSDEELQEILMELEHDCWKSQERFKEVCNGE